MKTPVQVKPAAWGAVGGAIAAMIIGFAWEGWVTGGTSEKNAGVAAQTAVVQAFVPLCVAKAEQQPEELILESGTRAPPSAPVPKLPPQRRDRTG
jgi:hypothetical protein